MDNILYVFATNTEHDCLFVRLLIKTLLSKIMSINITTNNNIALTKHTYVYFYTYTSDCQLQCRFTIKSHLRHCGTPNHFLMYELINTSSLSTVVKETSYTISGHNNLGNRPN